jgi:2-oxoisovalerate dehydrogenase E1 component
MEIKYEPYGLIPEEMIKIYEGMVFPRLIEEKMLNLLRQGKISKWFSGIGQEAIAVGVTSALDAEDYILPQHRNLGVFTTRKIPFRRLFAQWQGKKEGFSKGRDRSFHFGSLEHYTVGMISHLGSMCSVADGLALAHKLKKKNNISVVFIGEGATSEGDFHEAMNVAAVWDLPVLFVVENNGYGLSTPSSLQFRCEKISDKGKGYGIKSRTIDGNNILEVYKTIRRLRKNMLEAPAPFLLECNTFRIRGHEEASGVKYVPKETIEAWKKKDPIQNYESFLKNQGFIDDGQIEETKRKFKEEIEAGVKEVLELPEPTSTSDQELNDVYQVSDQDPETITRQGKETRFIDAISDGLRTAMKNDNQVLMMGQDIADYGGVFKITEGFLEEFGPERIRNTPICESAIVGTALGLALEGFKPVVEMQFADFVSCAFNQIVNNVAKTKYRWGPNVPMVIRMPTGGGVAAGPFHSQSTEAWFFHVPGLKIVYPSTAFDAKGLLLSALEDNNPVLYFEHKALYRSQKDSVPEERYGLPIGKARRVKDGEEAVIVTYGLGVRWAEEVVESLKLDVEILDLRSLLPWDKDAVRESVERTGKALVLHEASMTGGIGAEIAAWIGQHCFEHLDAPVKRVAGLDTPVPFHQNLEEIYMPKARLRKGIIDLLAY